MLISERELEQTAKAYGYKLKKSRKYLEKCTCGTHCTPVCWTRSGGGACFYECSFCGTRGVTSTNKRYARLAWNEMIEDIKKGVKKNGYCEEM